MSEMYSFNNLEMTVMGKGIISLISFKINFKREITKKYSRGKLVGYTIKKDDVNISFSMYVGEEYQMLVNAALPYAGNVTKLPPVCMTATFQPPGLPPLRFVVPEVLLTEQTIEGKEGDDEPLKVPFETQVVSEPVITMI